MDIKQGFKIKSQIDSLQWKYTNLKFSSSKHDNLSSSFKNSTENRLLKLAEIKKQIEQLQEELQTVICSIEDYIESTPMDDKLKVILIRRYCYLETFQEIAKDLCFSERYVYQLHNKALKKISVSSVPNQLENNSKV